MHDSEIIINTISKIELMYPVQNWIIGDVHIWPLLRTCAIVKHDMAQTKRNIPPPKTKSFFSRVKNLLTRRYNYNKVIRADFAGQSEKYQKCDILFLSYSMYRTFYSDKGIWDVHVLPLMKKLENQIGKIKYNILEVDVDNYNKQPRYGKSYYINYDLNMIATEIKIKKMCHRLHKLDVNLPCFKEVMQIINNNNIYFAAGNTISELREQAIYINEYVKYFEKIIRRSGAKVGITVYYYAPIGFAFNIACKNCGITTADLQHGLNSETHCSYANWNLLNNKYYKELPDNYLCWWKETQCVINRWSKNRGVYIGFPWAELWRTGGLLEKEYIQKINKYVIRGCDTHILYTMQTGLEIPSSVISAVNASPNNWQWWFRLHPSMVGDIDDIEKNLRVRVCNKNIEVRQATYMPLYALMGIVDIHITDYSSVYMECAMHGIPSIVFSGHNLYDSVKNTGMVQVIDAQSINFEIIAEQMKHGSNIDTQNEDDCENYFRRVLKI